jgi:hypothetical protein
MINPGREMNMATILRRFRAVIYWGFPGRKTVRFIPCEKMPYQSGLRLAVLYAKYKNELLR